jgi:hypothetical protein
MEKVGQSNLMRQMILPSFLGIHDRGEIMNEVSKVNKMML